MLNVPEDLLLDLAERVAQGTITADQASAALQAVAVDDGRPDDPARSRRMLDSLAGVSRPDVDVDEALSGYLHRRYR